MKAIRIYLFLFCIFLTAAQGGNWRKISGSYAYVEYEEPYDSLARSLLAIADAEIPRLAHLHGLSDKQIAHLPQARIIVTDKPDISNGYAIGNSVVIYALSSMYLPFWSERKSWYRLVLTHELTHWVTFKALHRRLSILGEASAVMVPRWFYEGIAQYFAESWNLFRGDYYIKQALLSGKLNAEALNNLANGRLLYASGNAFIRYLAFTYGDSALMRLMRYDSTGWYYDFDKAFKAVFKKDAQELFPDFVRFAVLYYGDFLADLPVASFPEPVPELIDRPTAVFMLSKKDSLYLVAGQEKSIDGYFSLDIVQLKKNKAHIVKRISGRLATQVCLSPDQRFIAYGEPYYSVESEQVALRFQWRIFDRMRNKSYPILNPMRSRYATFGSGQHLFLAEILADSSRLIRYDLSTERSKIIFKSSLPIGKLIAAGDDRLFFTQQRPGGDRQICEFEKGKASVLKGDFSQPYAPVCLSGRYLIFNEVRNEQPGITVFDLQADSVVSRWMDQFIYWVAGTPVSGKTLTVYRHEADGRAHFFSVPLDSLLQFSPNVHLPSPNRYGNWQKKKPLLPDTLTITPQGSTENEIKKQNKHFPFFPMEHLLSFALPFYDKEFGSGFYGSTVWLEILQRQLLTAGFWVTPLHPNRSIFLIDHELKWMNTDISTYVYYGPVFLTIPEGTRRQINFSLHRTFFLKGNERWQVGTKLSANYFYHHFKKNAPYPTRKVWFYGPSVRASLTYKLPTQRDAALPQRTFSINAFYFTTISGSNYKFHLIETNAMLGSKLLSDDFGIVERFSFIRQQGHLLPFQIVGVDRYYEFDMPREYLFSRTIRGLRENMDTDQILWNAFEVRYFLKSSTPYKLIFLPIKNVTMDGFLDYARLGSKNTREVSSAGLQLSFGDQLLRFSLGYAQTFKAWQKYDQTCFVRLAVQELALGK